MFDGTVTSSSVMTHFVSGLRFMMSGNLDLLAFDFKMTSRITLAGTSSMRLIGVLT